MAVEREHDGAGATPLGLLAHIGDHGLVPEVHAVVGADGDHRALTRPERLIEVGDHLHGQTVALRRGRPTAWPRRRGTVRTRRAAGHPSRRAPTDPTRRGGQHPALPDESGHTVVDGHDGHAPDGLDRAEQHALVGRRGLLDRERPDCGPAQVAQVGATAEEVAEVGGERAHVGPARADDLDRQNGRIGGRRHVEAIDRHGPRRPFDLDALAGQLVQAAPLDPDGRDHRRDLIDVTGEVLGHDTPGVVDAHPGHVVGRHDGTVGIERVGLDTEHDLAGVPLATVADVAHQPGHGADADDEDTRRARVERAGVADAPLAEASPEHADDVVAGDTGRLVDDGQAVHGRRPTTGHAAPRPLARSRTRRIAVRAARAIRAIAADDVLDPLGGTDDVVGTEVEDRASS